MARKRYKPWKGQRVKKMNLFGYPRFLVLLFALAASAAPFPGHSGVQAWCTEASTGELGPENTVVLANRVEARFSRDFSVLLKQLRVKWIIVEDASAPEAIKEKNLVLLGRLDDPDTGEIMRRVLSAEDIDRLHAAEGPVVIERDSPWIAGRRVWVCSGGDSLMVRDAAERAVRSIMERSPPASNWIRTRFDAPLDDGLRARVDELRFTWDDAELPLADLRMELGAKARRRISTQQAVEDVERLFYLFSHGYSGYAYFNQNGEFEQAKEHILEDLSARSSWSSSDFSRLLYEQLGFITDCHLNIGDYQYGGHIDFWYDSSLELTLGADGYQFTDDDRHYMLVSVDGEDPQAFVFPSLNAQGEAIYRLGTLSKVEPAPLSLLAAGDAGDQRLEIDLRRSDYDYHSRKIFREDRIGGIPVIRVRSFGDVYEEKLRQFVETGSAHSGEAVLIVDIRGNQGGNEAWPIEWIQRLTGRRADSVFVFSELHGKTTMAGRANVFTSLYGRHGDAYNFQEEAARYADLAEAFENGDSQPFWVGPYFPEMPLIPNDTTLIIATNGRVASAGEGLVMRVSRAENVVVVGENTRGCLTFGNAGTHRLPHSDLIVNLPINFGLYLDMKSREEEGIAPDLWVPAAEAVNYAVAAVRNGTITTRQPLPATVLQDPFVREDPWTRARRRNLEIALLIVLFSAGGGVWAYFVRKRPGILAAVGVVWLAVGGAWLLMGKRVGFGFLGAGAVCLLWSWIRLAMARERSGTT